MISPTLIASAASAAASLFAAQAPEPTPQTASDTVDKAEFLKLLVAQLQHQDPLNPLDSANFTAQLAQFSSLEQLIEINQRLAESGRTTNNGTRFDAVGFLGREVRGVSNVITVKDGTASVLDYELASAGVVQAKIIDASGREVASLVLDTTGAGPQRFDLATVPNTPTLADGTYTVSLTVSEGGGDALPVETTVSGRVTGIDLSSDPPVLLIGDLRLLLTDVLEIREAAA